MFIYQAFSFRIQPQFGCKGISTSCKNNDFSFLAQTNADISQGLVTQGQSPYKRAMTALKIFFHTDGSKYQPNERGGATNEHHVRKWVFLGKVMHLYQEKFYGRSLSMMGHQSLFCELLHEPNAESNLFGLCAEVKSAMEKVQLLPQVSLSF